MQNVVDTGHTWNIVGRRQKGQYRRKEQDKGAQVAIGVLDLPNMTHGYRSRRRVERRDPDLGPMKTVQTHLESFRMYHEKGCPNKVFQDSTGLNDDKAESSHFS